MSASKLSSPRDKRESLAPESNVPPAQHIRAGDQVLAVLGFAIDGFWHHYLRQFYIGPRRALNTAGVYAFWAGIWYCASHAGDWTHEAIARDQKLIPTAPVTDDYGQWDERSIVGATVAKNIQLEQQGAHFVAYSSLTTVPVLARLTYAYRPWFWQRRFPFKIAWLGMVGFTSLLSYGAGEAWSQSRSKVWEERILE